MTGLQLDEADRPVAEVVFDELDAAYGKSLLPLPPKAREALALARELATEFGYGYKTLLLEKTGKLLAFGSKKQMPFVAYRAMESLARLLHASYRPTRRSPRAPGARSTCSTCTRRRKASRAIPADPEQGQHLRPVLRNAARSLTDPYRLVPATWTASCR